MAAHGWPDWFAHLWYRTHHACLFAGMTLGFSLRCAGKHHMPASGPVLLVSNHQSYLDPPLVGLAVGRTLHYLARKTLFKHPFVAWHLSSVNTHPVDQEGMSKDGLKAIIQLLHEGKPVLVFPEGERTWTGEILPLKPGVHLLLKRAPVPVLPVGIAGAFESFPRTRRFPILSPLFLPATRGAVAVVVGKPLDPGRLLKLSREEFLRTVSDAIGAAQLRAERLRRKA